MKLCPAPNDGGQKGYGSASLGTRAPHELRAVALARVDGEPAALAVPAPARSDRRRRALGRVAVLAPVDETVAPSPLGRPGARVVVHSRDRTSAPRRPEPEAQDSAFQTATLTAFPTI